MLFKIIFSVYPSITWFVIIPILEKMNTSFNKVLKALNKIMHYIMYKKYINTIILFGLFPMIHASKSKSVLTVALYYSYKPYYEISINYPYIHRFSNHKTTITWLYYYNSQHELLVNLCFTESIFLVFGCPLNVFR